MARTQQQPPTLTFDCQRMAEDIAVKGWTKDETAVRAGVSDMTVIRFLRGEQQTARTAKKLSDALGYSVGRYLIRRPHPLRRAS